MTVRQRLKISIKNAEQLGEGIENLPPMYSITKLQTFLKTGKCNHKIGENLLCVDLDGHAVCITPAGQVYMGTRIHSCQTADGRRPYYFRHPLCDVINGVAMSYIPNGQLLISPKKKRAFTCLINGDDGGDFGHESSYYAGPIISPDQPTMSFACLGLFWGVSPDKSADHAQHALCENKVELIDYTADQNVSFTDAEMRKYVKHNPEGHRDKVHTAVQKAGLYKMGFTAVYCYEEKVMARWHSPGYCLVRIPGKKYVLLGVDDDQYFGVTLPAPATTVKEALKLLVPEEIRGKKHWRQGEWFLTRVNERDLPSVAECLVTDDGDDFGRHMSFILPRLTADDNPHKVHCFGGWRIGTDGSVYMENPEIHHDQHEYLSPPYGWYRAWRNTALESFSVDGVD